MAGYTQPVACTILAVSLMLGGGCSSLHVAMNSMMRRGAAIEEVVEKRVEYHSDLHEQRMAQKMSELDDRLRELNHTTCTQTDTTLAMEMSQSLEIQDITVDVAELKNVIARAEAHARAEELRRQRLPGLLREQREAFGGEGFGQLGRPNNFEQVAYDSNLRQASEEADIVVGIDEHGDPLPFCDVKGPAAGPAIGPSEIPYLVRMKINVGLQNPRVERSEVRRQPGCGLPDCHGKGGSKCACTTRFDQQRYAVAGTQQSGGPQGDSYMQVADGWPIETNANQLRSQQTASRPSNYPPSNSPYEGVYSSSPTSPEAGVRNGQSTRGEPNVVRVQEVTPGTMPAVFR